MIRIVLRARKHFSNRKKKDDRAVNSPLFKILCVQNLFFSPSGFHELSFQRTRKLKGNKKEKREGSFFSFSYFVLGLHTCKIFVYIGMVFEQIILVNKY